MTHPNPVPDAEIEAVALVILKSQRDSELNEFGRALNSATAAIAVLTPMIAEKCAKIALSQASVLRARGNTSLTGETMLMARAIELESLASAIRSAFPLPSPVGGETK